MKKFIQAAGVAAIAAVASWAVQRLLESRALPTPRAPRKHFESWENEGGALAPHPAGFETSQVPR